MVCAVQIRWSDPFSWELPLEVLLEYCHNSSTYIRGVSESWHLSWNDELLVLNIFFILSLLFDSLVVTLHIRKQVEAEIRIAAYEACAYALKDLVSLFSPMTVGIMTDSDGSFHLEHNKALLDVFVCTFVHHIDQIIDGGKLARTRRAVLMNWKVTLPFITFIISIWSPAFCNFFF